MGVKKRRAQQMIAQTTKTLVCKFAKMQEVVDQVKQVHCKLHLFQWWERFYCDATDQSSMASITLKRNANATRLLTTCLRASSIRPLIIGSQGGGHMFMLVDSTFNIWNKCLSVEQCYYFYEAYFYADFEFKTNIHVVPFTFFQKIDFTFCKVVWRRYSGEVGKFYETWWLIYPRHCTSISINIGQGL